MESTKDGQVVSMQMQNEAAPQRVDIQKVDSYIMVNNKYFPSDKIPYMKEKLSSMNNVKFELVTSTKLKDPTILLVISLVVGVLGVDRFMLGNIGFGIVKLITCWFPILAIIDLFTVMKRTREYNFNKISVLM